MRARLDAILAGVVVVKVRHRLLGPESAQLTLC
jgi:hypothetical protein